MTERLIGETGSRKRRRFLILPVVMVSFIALFVIAGAQAVHDEGVFELEGNAVAGNTGVGTGSDPSNPQSQPPGGDDWDAVYDETDSAEATAFVGDPTIAVPSALAGAGDSILSTEHEGHPGDRDWDWKQTLSTSVQDKADIEHAYAAQYVVDKSGAGETCGTAPATTSASSCTSAPTASPTAATRSWVSGSSGRRSGRAAS